MRTKPPLLLLAIAISCVLPSVAFAGDVGGFGDSLRGSRDTSPSSSPSSDDDDDGWDWSSAAGYEDNDSEAFDTVWSWFWGDNPGALFTFGQGPYNGRYRLSDQAEYASLTTDVFTTERVAQGPQAQLGFGAYATGTTSVDGLGGGAEASIATSYAPTLSAGLLSILDVEDAGSALRVFEARVEPNFALFEQGRVYWGAGISHFADAQGSIGGAFALALGADLYPYDPFSIKLRGQVHLMGSLAIWDGSARAGIQATDNVSVEVGIRTLSIDGGAIVAMPTLGVAWSKGF